MDEQSLFLRALDISTGEQRTAWLDEACGSDSSLRQRIEALLRTHEQAGSFLEKPAPELDATIVQETSAKDLADSLHAGLAPAFHADKAIVVGSASHSVLKSLGQTAGNVPRVVLRDNVEGATDPMVRPRSPEMPDRDAESRYQLQGEIARGGMGAILKGRDTDLGRDLAIKVLLDEHKAKPEIIQRFVEEAQIGGQLQHPGIAPVYELGQFADRRPFFSMKLVKGQTLGAILAKRKEPGDDRAELLGTFEHVCQTMAYAHSRGVIHRDLKPANIMVGAFGEVQVMDWGLAKVLAEGGVADEKKAHTKHKDVSAIQTRRSGGSDQPRMFGSQTQMGSVMGTPAYMPPEQALGEIDNLDERADVFGLGAILCEILTGKPPYVGEDGTEIFRKASRGKLEDAFSRLDAAELDPELLALAKNCLALEPKDRPQNAGEVVELLSDYLHGVQERLREAELAKADAQARAEELVRRRKLIYAIAAMLLVGLVTAAFAATHFRSLEQTQRTLAQEKSELATRNEKLAEDREAERNLAVAARKDAEQAQRATAEALTLAKAAEQEARTAEETGRELLYATDMELVPFIWNDPLATAVHLTSRLDAHDPEKNLGIKAKDLRGFEWYYYKHLVDSSCAVFSGHDAPVMACALDSGGHLVTLDEQLQLKRWDAETRREIHSVELRQGRGVGRKALSPDGRMVALAVGNDVLLLNTATGQETNRLSNAPTGHGLLFSSDSSRLVTFGEDGARWWDTSNGTLYAKDGRTGWEGMAVAADGLTIAWGNGWVNSANATIDIRRVDPSDKKTSLVGHFDVSRAGALALSPDGELVVFGGFYSGTVSVFECRTGTIVAHDVAAHASSITAIAFDPRGSRLVTAANDGTIKVWKDARSLDSVVTLKGHTGAVTQVQFSSDGTRILSSSADKTARIWDLSQPGVVHPLENSTATFFTARFSPDGLLIAGADGGNRVKLWDAATGQLVRTMSSTDSGRIHSVAFSPDNRLLAAGLAAGSISQVVLWDIDRCERLAVFPGRPGARDQGERYSAVGALAFSPNGKYLVAGFGHPWVWYNDRGSALRVWDISARELVHELNADKCVSIAFSHDGSLMAAGSHDGVARIWRVTTWETICEHRISGNVHRDKDGHFVFDVAFSPDDKTLAVVGGKNIDLLDAQTGRLIRMLDGHSNAIRAVAFSPNGRTLVSCSSDKTIRLWNTATWRELTRLDHEGINSSHVLTAAFSPDGRQLAAGRHIWSTRQPVWTNPELAAERLQVLLGSQADFQSRIRMFSENLSLHDALTILRQRNDDAQVQAALAATKANWHAAHKQWAESVTQFDQLVQLSPENPGGWLRTPGLFRLATALLHECRAADAASLLAGGAERHIEDGALEILAFGFSHAGKVPLRLTDVLEGSPASNGGLVPGDIILKVNDVELTTATSFDDLFVGDAGTKVQLTVQHPMSDEPVVIELTKERFINDPATRELLTGLRVAVNEQLAIAPEDPGLVELYAELAGGSYARARAGGAELRSKLERQLQVTPDDPWLARELADLLLKTGAPVWTILKPVEMNSQGDTTLTRLSDNSVLASGGNPAGDRYQLVMETDQTAIAALRLEALTHPTLPNNGPGRDVSGIFDMHWEIKTAPRSEPERLQTLTLRSAFADHSFPRFPITTSRWNITTGQGVPHQAYFDIETPLQSDSGFVFTIAMWGNPSPDYRDQVLGRFRLCVTDRPGAFEHERDRLAALQLTDPWEKLAAVYRLTGDEAGLEKLKQLRTRSQPEDD